MSFKIMGKVSAIFLVYSLVLVLAQCPVYADSNLNITVDNTSSDVSGVPITNTRDVVLKFNAGNDVAKMAISNYSDFHDASQEAYQSNKSWRLTEGDGLKTVYVKFFTQWGQSSSTMQTSIILKSSTDIKPTATNVVSGPTTSTTTSKPITNTTTKVTTPAVTVGVTATVKQSSLNSGANGLFSSSTQILKQGMRSNEVLKLQQFLAKQGLLKAKINSYYGVNTRQAVIDFQKKYGLPVTGQVAEKTKKVMSAINSGQKVSTTNKTGTVSTKNSVKTGDLNSQLKDLVEKTQILQKSEPVISPNTNFNF